MANKRLREIVRVFSSVGFTTLKERKKPLDEQMAPAKLRLAFEQLGPSFVKIGQILSTRSDLLPDAYIKELTRLQSNVLPLDKVLVMSAIEAELTQPLFDVFQSIDERPLASGSVAQTHRAILKTGQEVVVKIQRPHLAEIVDEDLSLLIGLSKKMPSGLIPMVNLTDVLYQLKDSLTTEIDFRNEAKAMLKFAELNRRVKCVAVPKVYDELTTSHMVVEEFIQGIPINRYEDLVHAGYDLEDIGQKLMLSFIKQVFKDGYFHGDPHPGNLLIKDGQIYFIDFGIMGHLENDMRAALNDILYSFTAQDIDGMTQGILTITNFDTSMNKAELSRDVERMLNKYSSLNLGALSITYLLEDLVKVFVNNHLKASPQITVLEKAVLQIEGIFRDLAPDKDLMTLAKDYFIENMGPDMLEQALNKETLLIELFYLLKNGKNKPRRANQLLEQILNGRILINHDLYDYNNRIKIVTRMANRFVLSLVFLALLISASLLSLNAEMLVMSKLLFVLAGLVLIWIFVGIFRE